MAKKEKPVFNYNLEIKRLNEKGPERLYLLYGQEDYLRERFVDELKKQCVGDLPDFNYKILNGASLDMAAFSEAVDSVPFFGERCLVEVRSFDINKCKDSDCDKFKAIISDIPEYCTIALILNPDYEMDGRLAAVKAAKKFAWAIEFTEQGQDMLTKWIGSRFSALGKSISRTDAEYLCFVSGTLMNRLIPEIEKIAAYSSENFIQRSDIDAAAHRIPEADVFEMTDLLSQGKIDAAAKRLSELISDKDNTPIYIHAIFSRQIRMMYAFKLAQSKGQGRSEIMELCKLRFNSHFEKMKLQVKMYSLEALKSLVELCTEYDYMMKSSGIDNEILLKELLIKVAISEK